jgi:hypothetical protein
MSNDSLNSSKGTWAARFLWLMFLCAYWCLSTVVLWWAYDFSPLIRDGYYVWREAVLLVIQMGLIMSILSGAIWFFQSRRVQCNRSLWKQGWGVFGGTALINLAYVFLVFMRRELWDPSQGINEDAMFLPLVGHVNGAFFSEFRWLSFVVFVIPMIGLISAMLFLLRLRLGAGSDQDNSLRRL